MVSSVFLLPRAPYGKLKNKTISGRMVIYKNTSAGYGLLNAAFSWLVITIILSSWNEVFSFYRWSVYLSIIYGISNIEWRVPVLYTTPTREAQFISKNRIWSRFKCWRMRISHPMTSLRIIGYVSLAYMILSSIYSKLIDSIVNKLYHLHGWLFFLDDHIGTYKHIPEHFRNEWKC